MPDKRSDPVWPAMALSWLLLSAGIPGGVAGAQEHPSRPYVVVDTGQDRCYDCVGYVIAPPRPGDACYGQDAQYRTVPMRFRDNGDGTVSDLNTGLMWQQMPGPKTTLDEALSAAASLDLAGYTDWRVPTIKELYSLICFNGMTGMTETTSIPYIDIDYFAFRYGDPSAGERLIDAQYWSSTKYVSTTMGGSPTVFGVNFADGRIKGYPLYRPGANLGHQMYVRYVRGNPGYGVNDFVDNGDGTVTDRATGLMWMQVDSGHLGAGPAGDGRLNWQQALVWAEGLEYAGYSDWRLPDAKELQSIVDYSRSPGTTASAAIDPVFATTVIFDADGVSNYPCFWTSTTHLDGPHPGNCAVYIAFGEAQGYMRPPGYWGAPILLDVHGAGAQRSDPKSGDPARFPYGRGPQGDVIRIYNYVRCVRGGL